MSVDAHSSIKIESLTFKSSFVGVLHHCQPISMANTARPVRGVRLTSSQTTASFGSCELLNTWYCTVSGSRVRTCSTILSMTDHRKSQREADPIYGLGTGTGTYGQTSRQLCPPLLAR